MMTDALRWLFDGLIAHLDRGELTEPLLLVLLCLAGPLLWACWWRAFVLRKIKRLYREVIQEKDAEIARIVKLCGGRAVPVTASAAAPAVEKLPFSQR
jgi:hypothetical protein